MDTDFHFYGTYYAARVAGFDKADATIIAGAAQFVDDNYEDFSDNTEKISILLDTNDEYTMASMMTGMDGPLFMAKKANEHHRQLWPVFHFLPGNYQIGNKALTLPGHQMRHHRLAEKLTEENKVKYLNSGKEIERDRNERMNYKISNSLTDKMFAWLCRPNSILAKEMIDNTRDFFQEHKDGKQRRLALHLIGVRMHVLADTFAHQDFVGAADKNINSVLNCNYYIGGEGKWTKTLGSPFEYIFDEETHINRPDYSKGMWRSDTWASTPDSIGGQEGTAFLGHGAAGHLPDMGYLCWGYTPGWSNDRIIRNNPQEFFKAFVTLVEAMKYIQEPNITGNGFRPLADDDYKMCIVDKHENIRRGISFALPYLSQLAPEKWLDWSELVAHQSNAWIKAFQPLYPNELTESNVKDPKSAEHKKLLSGWQKEAETYAGTYRFTSRPKLSLETAIVTDYILFTLAAKKHYKFVSSMMIYHGMPLQLNDGLDSDANTNSKLLDEISKLFITTPPDIGKKARDARWKKECRTALDKCFRMTKHSQIQDGLRFLEIDLLEAQSARHAHQVLTERIETENFYYFAKRKEMFIKALEQQLETEKNLNEVVRIQTEIEKHALSDKEEDAGKNLMHNLFFDHGIKDVLEKLATNEVFLYCVREEIKAKARAVVNAVIFTNKLKR